MSAGRTSPQARTIRTGPRKPATTTHFGTFGRSTRNKISPTTAANSSTAKIITKIFSLGVCGLKIASCNQSNTPHSLGKARSSDRAGRVRGKSSTDPSGCPALTISFSERLGSSVGGPRRLDCLQRGLVVLTGDPCGQLRPLGTRADRGRHQVGGVEPGDRLRVLQNFHRQLVDRVLDVGDVKALVGRDPGTRLGLLVGPVRGRQVVLEGLHFGPVGERGHELA